MDLFKNTINEVVVVEGYHDLAKLREVYPTLDIVITNGSETSEETLKELKILNQTRGLILFLDPDYQGERIRRKINDYVGETKHSFLKKEDCISKNNKKVGIEHASSYLIKEALDNTLTSSENTKIKITLQELYNLNLIGHKNAKQLRKKIVDYIGIGLCNGKTLHNKLNMFNITKEEILHILGK